MDDTGVLLVVGALVLGAVVGFLLCPKPVVVPYVDTGADIQLNECCSTRLTCEGYDPLGGAVTYHWTAEDGEGSFNDVSVLHPTYTAPPICGYSDDITLTLTVTNKQGLSASDSMVARVRDMVCSLPLERCRPITPAPCCVTPIPSTCPAESPQPRPIVNHPPVANAGDDIVMTECTTVQLTCGAYDPDGDPVTCYWTAVGGRGAFDNPRALHPRYTLPAVDDCKARDFVFLSLTVTDSHGLSATDSLVVHVNKARLPHYPTALVPCCPRQVTHVPPCCPPIPQCMNAASAKSVNEGGSIKLHGTVCDPDNNVVRYKWTADKGAFDDPTSLNPTYCAPMTTACEGEYACITLTAMDSCLARGVDRLIIHIKNVNQLPTADAGEDITIGGGTSVQLTCSASDPDGDALSYHWTAPCNGGRFDNPYALHPMYTAPSTDRCGKDVVLTLTVTDACGASASNSMIAHMNNATNVPPTVKADP